MRIASIVTSFTSGGAEILTRNLAAAFVQSGHKCLVVAITRAGLVGNSTTFEAAYVEELRAAGVEVHVMSGRTRLNIPSGAAQFRHLMNRWKPDIVHCHAPYGLLFQLLGHVRCPTIYTHHNTRLNFPPVLFRAFDRFVDRYVAISGPCAALLERYVARPITFVANGVPANFANGDPRTSLPLHPVVLSIGALTAQKDYPTLVHAAALCVPAFQAVGRRIRFRIAGGGETSSLQGIIEANGLSDHVDLLGTRMDVAQLMAEADLLVNSSIYEGLPISLIEGTMSALPIIATDVGGNGEIVEDGLSGYLVPPRRSDLLADAIFNLLSDGDRYLAFSARAKMLSAKFTLEACSNRYLRLFEQVVGKWETPMGEAHDGA